MISSFLKRLIALSALIFCFDGGVHAEENLCGEIPTRTISSCMEQEGWTISDGLSEIKDHCKEYKDKATACCGNPNECSGLGRDLAQNVLPMTPALYGTYKAYKISSAAGSGKLSPSEAAAKMCDARNKVNMGSYLSGLFSQISGSMEKTCSDKISECKAQCNSRISDFKKDFKRCFGHLVPSESQTDLDKIVQYVKECAGEEGKDISKLEIEKISILRECEIQINDKINSGDTVFNSEIEDIRNEIGNIKKKLLSCREGPVCAPLDRKKIEFEERLRLEEEQKKAACAKWVNPIDSVKDILRYAKAYAHSSVKEGKKVQLSKASDERQIVDCAKQEDRVLARSNTPGAPVPAPLINICKQAVEEFLNRPPPITTIPPDEGPPSRHTGTLTGNTTPDPFLLAGDGSPTGIVDDEDEESHDSKTGPPLSKNVPSWGKDSSPSTGGSPGGLNNSGALTGNSGPSSKKGRGFGYPYPGSKEPPLEDSFSGNDSYSSPSLRGGGADFPPYRQAASSPDGSDKKSLGDPLPSDEPESNGNSIFQIASQRIQQFCSDHSCIK